MKVFRIVSSILLAALLARDISAVSPASSYHEIIETLLKASIDEDHSKRRHLANDFNALIKETNRKKAREQQPKKVEFSKLSEYDLLIAAAEAMRFLPAYRQDSAFISNVAPTLNDLEFFLPETGLFSSLDRTKTVAGRIVLAAMLANPLVDSETIYKRRQLLVKLINDPDLAASLEQAVQQFADVQEQFFAFWNRDPALDAMIESRLYHGFLGVQVPDKALGAYHMLKVPFTAAAAFLVGTYMGELGALKADYNFFYQVFNVFKGRRELKNPYMGSIFGIGGLYLSVSSQSENIELVRYLHKRGLAVAEMFRATAKLQSIFDSCEYLQAVIKNSGTYSKIFSDQDAFTKTFLEVQKTLLENPAYKKNASPLWHLGTVLNTDKKIRQILDQLGEFIEMGGEADALLSIVKLIKEHKDKPAGFCLVDTASTTHDPHLALKNFWHPAIAPTKVVTNSIHFENGFRGIILTGSNTGGKSTALKAILLSAVLGQGWGIAPASDVVVTPFSFIGSFMNIGDDIRDRASLFQAEVDRARTLVDISKDVVRHEIFGIVILDELFTGTNPEDGYFGSELVANKLFVKERMITLLASHYKDMPKIADQYPDQVKAYKMDVQIDVKGRPIHTYKLQLGVSEVGMAQRLFFSQL